MQVKLIKYIENQFTQKEKDVNNDYIKEITANILERYADELKTGYSESEAYIRCIDYLGNVRSGANIDNVTAKPRLLPISMYIVFCLTFASLIIYNFNTFWSFVILCLSIIFYNIELRSQVINSKNNNHNSTPFLIKCHKYLIIPWSFIISVILLETLSLMLDNNAEAIKFTYGFYFNTEPVGILFLVNLIFFMPIFILLSLYHNYLYCSYYKFDNTMNKNLRYKFWKRNPKTDIDYSKHKNIEFIIFSLFTLISIALVLFSKVYEYGLAFDPVTEEIIGWQLSGIITFYSYNIFRIPESVTCLFLFIVIGFILIYMITSILYKKIRTVKNIKILNIVFFVVSLAVVISQMFQTGIRIEFGFTTSYIFAMLILMITMGVSSKNLQVLNYE